MPAAAGAEPAGRLGELVEQVGEIGAVQHLGDLPAAWCSCRWAIGGDHHLVGVEQAPFVAGQHGVDDGGPGPDAPQGAALDELAEPVPFVLGEVEQFAAAVTCSGGWRSSTRVWMSDSNPAAIFAEAVPSSSCAVRSDGRWQTSTVATPGFGQLQEDLK